MLDSFYYNGGHCLQRFPLFLLIILMPVIYLSAQTTVIPLYPGVAPGSENWNWQEGVTTNTPAKFRIAYNISRPTLTVYQPDSSNGTGLIVIPGGGGYVVNIDNEGEKIARELIKRGVTVFVLKYRTGRITSTDPWKEMLANLKDREGNRHKMEQVRSLIAADGFAAIRYVRDHASNYQLNPNKIGALGFSFGGGITLRLCKSTDSVLRPDFAGLIYTVYRPAEGDTLPSSVPPVFIACASDDLLGSPTNSTSLYNAFLEAGQHPELHIYKKGSHGLRESVAARNWIRRFEEWMEELGVL